MPLTKFPAAIALAAACSMVAAPLAAVELPEPRGASVPVATPAVWESDSVNADGHRHRRYRDHTDFGDLLTGVLIIGGIAAIASAVTDDSDDRYRDARYPDRPYDYRERGDYRDYSDGIDKAVDMCLAAIERDTRVERVEQVDRTAEGWEVAGSLYNGERFTCRIDNDGRIADIDVGGAATWNRDSDYDGDADVVDRQWDDSRYQQAWRARDTAAAQLQPAYPGGPLPGEPGYAEAEADAD